MSVELKWLTMEAAGPLFENPLPLFRNENPDLDAAYGEHLTPEEAEGFAKNGGFRILPYLSQDRYDRDVKPRKTPVIIMENEHLRALVLPTFGGRLWSLYDKDKAREVFFRNPVIQPCNLAIRDAWLSGGVEWNIGQLGHTFTTCSPLFCAKLTDEKGEPFLRMYEYERQKKLFWQVDLHLPAGAKQIAYHVRIVNDGDASPMYWWTNTAVVEDETTRVFVPGGRALYRRCDLPGNVQDMGQMPFFHVMSDKDLSYGRNLPRSNDFFIQIPPEERSPWEAAAYGDGRVTFERSTALLHYRKMFCWGDLPGGDRWKSFLSREGEGSYLEIQAGIARSQLHGITMPAGAVWRFSAVMGTLDADASRTHGVPWQEGVEYMAQRIAEEVSADEIDRLHERLTALDEITPNDGELLFTGSGWGALEALRRQKIGQKIPAGYYFPEATLGAEQAPWTALLQTGSIPDSAPVSYLVDAPWKAMLKASPDSWQKWYHLGVCAAEDLDRAEALDCFRRSAAMCPNVWNRRAIAVLTGDAEQYAALLGDGVPDVAFVQEYFALLWKQGNNATITDGYAVLPEEYRANERVQMFAVRAELAQGITALCDGGFFDRTFVDIREGETSLSDLWYDWQTVKAARERGVAPDAALKAELCRTLTPPHEIDFRMEAAK